MNGRRPVNDRNVRFLFAAMLIVAGGASADDSSRSVVTARHIEASPAQVLDAFVRADDLAAWWYVSRSLVVPRDGGIWSVSWDDWGPEKTQHSWTGTIGELSADRLVVRDMVMNEPDLPLFGPMTLDIRVQPDGDGALVTVSHDGYRSGAHWDTMHDLVVDGWEHVLGDLADWFAAEY